MANDPRQIRVGRQRRTDFRRVARLIAAAFEAANSPDINYSIISSTDSDIVARITFDGLGYVFLRFNDERIDVAYAHTDGARVQPDGDRA